MVSKNRFIGLIGIAIIVFLVLISSWRDIRGIKDTTKNPDTNTISLKRFLNENGGYTFIVPDGWTVAINKYNIQNSLFGPSTTEKSGLGGVEIMDGYRSIEDYLSWITRETSIDKILNKKEIKAGAVDAVRYNYEGIPSGEAVNLFHKGKIYNIYINSQEGKDIMLFDKIIDSFILIE